MATDERVSDYDLTLWAEYRIPEGRDPAEALHSMALELIALRTAAGDPVAWLIEYRNVTPYRSRVVFLHNAIADYPGATCVPLFVRPPATGATEADGEIDRLSAGLRWYADGNHFQDMQNDWEEEEGWLCPPGDQSWMVEPGHVARAILDGQHINPDADADEITLSAAPAKVGR